MVSNFVRPHYPELDQTKKYQFEAKRIASQTSVSTRYYSKPPL